MISGLYYGLCFEVAHKNSLLRFGSAAWEVLNLGPSEIQCEQATWMGVGDAKACVPFHLLVA